MHGSETHHCRLTGYEIELVTNCWLKVLKVIFLAMDVIIGYEELVLSMHDEFVVSLDPPLLQPAGVKK